MMTTNRSFKKAVRARMELTGESYAKAREVLLATQSNSPPQSFIVGDTGVGKHSPWVFDLGVTEDQEVISWDVRKNPHLLVSGRAGSGKSVLSRLLIQHCQQYDDNWEVFVLDPTSREFASERSSVVKEVVFSLEDAERLLRHLIDMMNSRFAEMEKSPASQQLSSRTLVIIEHPKMYEWNYSLDDNTATPTPHFDLIRELLRKGRTAGIHVVMSTQRLVPQFHENFSARVTLGKISDVEAVMMFGGWEATEQTKGFRAGDGLFSADGEPLVQFRVPYFS